MIFLHLLDDFAHDYISLDTPRPFHTAPASLLPRRFTPHVVIIQSPFGNEALPVMSAFVYSGSSNDCSCCWYAQMWSVDLYGVRWRAANGALIMCAVIIVHPLYGKAAHDRSDPHGLLLAM